MNNIKFAAGEHENRRNMKKIPRRAKIAGAGVAGILFIGFFVWGQFFYEDPLIKQLSDGTIVRIEKVEITKQPSFDNLSLWNKTRLWLREREWGVGILDKTGFLANMPTAPYSREYSSPRFAIWYSISNPKKNFIPLEIVPSSAKGKGLWNSPFPAGKSFAPWETDAYLKDEHGCRFARGTFTAHDRTDGPVYSVVFYGFNQSSPQTVLGLKFPGEKEPVIFLIKTPNLKPGTASPEAVPLPAEKKFGDLSIQIRGFGKTVTKDFIRVDPWIYFKKNNANADDKYAALTYDIFDSSGGDESICFAASEWIVKGHAGVSPFCKRPMEAIDADAHISLTDLKYPNIQECRPVSFAKTGKKFPAIASAYVVGAGGYVFDEEKLLESFKITEGDALTQKSERYVMDKYRIGNRPNWFQSGNRERTAEGDFHPRQILDDTGSGCLDLFTKKPALVLKIAKPVPEYSAVYLENKKLNRRAVDKDYFWSWDRKNNGRWVVLPLEWKESEGAQDFEIGFAASMPFEFHILTDAKLRESLAPAPATK